MIVLIIIGFILLLVGLIGCVVPGIAGPPFSFLALILLSIAKRWEPFSPGFLIGMAVLTIVVTALDYIVPAAGAKKFGASRYGFWGAIFGMILFGLRNLLPTDSLTLLLSSTSGSGAAMTTPCQTQSLRTPTWAAMKA